MIEFRIGDVVSRIPADQGGVDVLDRVRVRQQRTQLRVARAGEYGDGGGGGHEIAGYAVGEGGERLLWLVR